MATFGEKIRELRNKKNLPLRKVAAHLDIDPSTLSKIERAVRNATIDMLPIFSKVLEIDQKELKIDFLSDKVAYELLQEESTDKILKVAEEKIRYLKAKNSVQGKLNF